MVEVLEILHVESGNLPVSFEKNLERIRRKFTLERKKALIREVLDKIVLELALNKFIIDYSRLDASDIKFRYQV